MKNRAERIFGLDLMRAVAILLVLFAHSSHLIDGPNGYISSINLPDGVDLFFVLSGYLIGKIILDLVQDQQKLDFKTGLNFLIRRWLRTLPNYYLFLIINIVLISFSLIPGFLNQYTPAYFVFMQNFHIPGDFFFWESWSLAVEEWFYLLFPLCIYTLYKLNKSFFKFTTKRIVFVVILIFILLPLMYRLLQSSPELDWDLYFRKLVLTRMDTIAFGLLGAYIHTYYGEQWNKSKNWTFLLGLSLLTAINVFETNNYIYLQTVYFSITGISIALLLPKLSNLTLKKAKFQPIQYLSKISYSIYLVQLPVFHTLTNQAHGRLSDSELFILFILITIFFSAMIYHFYEKPIMKLRDRAFFTIT